MKEGVVVQGFRYMAKMKPEMDEGVQMKKNGGKIQMKK